MEWIKQHPGLCLSLVVAVALFSFLDLGDAAPDVETVPVSGTVTLDGAPVPTVRVSFQPMMNRGIDPSSCPGSFAVTDADGRYELRWSDGSGAVAGEHVVTFVDPQPVPSQADDAHPTTSGKTQTVTLPDGSVQEIEQLEPDMTVRLPEKARNGTLRYLVPEGGTDSADFAFASE